MTADERTYERAFNYASQKHAGQMRKDGAPYIMHPVAVADIVKEWGYGIDYQVTALFHDLLEDTDAEESVIAEIGGDAVLKAVKLLTKKKGYVMSKYVAGIKNDPIAYKVKAADRLHNLQCAVNTDDEFKRKYIYETLDWYMDFAPEIPAQVKELARSMETTLDDIGFDYESGTEWKKDKE
ncbi:MAG: bifunctional (p)ppGpp synthetase/guanosine-3',5'-bis(diphosphate) 3'-pyrophosphohydrolase [Christensenellaceae bacterium]|nr:bifunctional (p)ppGpp synthetase/guanosine-3',5'-bis(diphosphate) 3'-pyrophosphohydrolase [Christensenellaceae bacterium]